VREYVTVVSGLPRSGTSMLMKMLEKGKISPYTDNIRVADSDNPEGYYEFDLVKKLKQNNTWLSKCKGHSVKIVSPLIKNIALDLNYKVIFIDRDMKEILASQNKMLLNRGEATDIDDATITDYYESHLVSVKEWLSSKSNIATLHVNYNDTIKNPEGTVKQISNFLNIQEGLELMANVVMPNLYRNRVK
tara:strand:+ start:2668 stop:3237 length:570 start_codon:yes stop_codon:yes gene_type:complete